MTIVFIIPKRMVWHLVLYGLKAAKFATPQHVYYIDVAFFNGWRNSIKSEEEHLSSEGLESW